MEQTLDQAQTGIFSEQLQILDSEMRAGRCFAIGHRLLMIGRPGCGDWCSRSTIIDLQSLCLACWSGVASAGVSIYI